jgi:hypothetical protein
MGDGKKASGPLTVQAKGATAELEQFDKGSALAASAMVNMRNNG